MYELKRIILLKNYHHNDKLYDFDLIALVIINLYLYSTFTFFDLINVCNSQQNFKYYKSTSLHT